MPSHLPTTRTLILMRHAKSGYPGGVRDHDRPLADRGEREGALAGVWLRGHLPVVDEVLCSTAVRTRRTVEVAGVDAPIRWADEIYEATPDDILEQVRKTADDIRTLLVVGHAPGLPGLAVELAGEGSREESLEQMCDRFPTAAIAVLRTVVDWSELRIGEAQLIDYQIPRA